MTTILHVSFDYSGAKKYSDDIVRNITKYTSDFTVFHIRFMPITALKEVSIIEYETHNEIWFPYFDLVGNKKSLSLLFRQYLLVLSIYYPISESIIIHLNTEAHYEIMEVSFKRNNVKFLATMHFVPKLNNINILNNLFYQKMKLDCSFIAVTQYCKKVLTDVFRINPNNVFVVYNGIDKEEVVKKERTDFGFGLEEILILYVGRLERDKGVDVLIDVFSDLADQYSNIRLLLVGGGDFQDMFSIIKKNNSRITFFGQISPKNTHQLYDLCDIGVIPSLIEQCSYVALEMMSHKVPMLVSNINGISEIIKNNECFIPISNKNPVTIDKSMFFSKLEEFVKNKELRLKLGNSALIHWNDNYRLERMVKETVDVYTALITSMELNSNIENIQRK